MPSTSGLSYITITSLTGDEVSGLIIMVVDDDGTQGRTKSLLPGGGSTG